MFAISTSYNEQLEAAQRHIGDDSYDMVECGPEGQPKSDLLNKLLRCSIASINALRLSSANSLRLFFHHEFKLSNDIKDTVKDTVE